LGGWRPALDALTPAPHGSPCRKQLEECPMAKKSKKAKILKKAAKKEVKKAVKKAAKKSNTKVDRSGIPPNSPFSS
jgi:hypothetical protein